LALDNDRLMGDPFFRFYNPAIGRFMTPDNVLPSPTDSLSYDRYAYTRNNPINLIDPTGNEFVAATWIFVAISAAVGATIAYVNHGNVMLGAVTGAISGALTYLGAPSGPGAWGYLAVTQTVNVALHATSGGQWMIQKVGNAVGSQILGDVLVTALATAGALRATKAGVGGETEGMSVGEAEAKIAELEAKTARSAAEEAQLAQFRELVKQDYPAFKGLELGKERFTSGGDTFGGPSVVDMIKEGRVADKNVTLWFKAASAETGNSADLIAISALAPVKGAPFFQHISVDSTNPAILKDFAKGEYLISATCQQTAAKGLSRVMVAQLSPFSISSHWSVFLTTGLYGYYGSPFILPFTIIQAYEYKEYN